MIWIVMAPASDRYGKLHAPLAAYNFMLLSEVICCSILLVVRCKQYMELFSYIMSMHAVRVGRVLFKEQFYSL